MVFAQFAQFELLGEMVADECRRLGAGLLPFEGQQNRTQALQLLCNDNIRARGMRMDAGHWVRGCWHLKANRTAPSGRAICANWCTAHRGGMLFLVFHFGRVPVRKRVRVPVREIVGNRCVYG